VGQVLRDKKQARGSYFYKNGDVYEGEWEENLRHGRGHFVCHKGDQCRGEFTKDEFVSGSYTDAMGSTYRNLDNSEKSGYFFRGRLFGYGKIEFSDGGLYEGMFKDGKRSG
jgi:hypothetical protein